MHKIPRNDCKRCWNFKKSNDIKALDKNFVIMHFAPLFLNAYFKIFPPLDFFQLNNFTNNFTWNLNEIRKDNTSAFKWLINELKSPYISEWNCLWWPCNVSHFVGNFAQYPRTHSHLESGCRGRRVQGKQPMTKVPKYYPAKKCTFFIDLSIDQSLM